MVHCNFRAVRGQVSEGVNFLSRRRCSEGGYRTPVVGVAAHPLHLNDVGAAEVDRYNHRTSGGDRQRRGPAAGARSGAEAAVREGAVAGVRAGVAEGAAARTAGGRRERKPKREWKRERQLTDSSSWSGIETVSPQREREARLAVARTVDRAAVSGSTVVAAARRDVAATSSSTSLSSASS